MVLGCVCYDLMLVYYVYCVGALVAGYQTTEFSVYSVSEAFVFSCVPSQINFVKLAQTVLHSTDVLNHSISQFL